MVHHLQRGADEPYSCNQIKSNEMTYDTLQQLIEDRITRQLEELRLDAMDLKLRNSAKVSALNTVLLALTDEQRIEVAKKLNLVR